MTATLYFESAALVFTIKVVAFIGALVVCSVYIQNPSILPVSGVPSNEVVSLANEMSAFKSESFTSAKETGLSLDNNFLLDSYSNSPFLKECVSITDGRYQASRIKIYNLITYKSNLETLLSWEVNDVVANRLKEKIKVIDFTLKKAMFFHKLSYPTFSEFRLEHYDY